jgi:hypothetical protein
MTTAFGTRAAIDSPRTTFARARRSDQSRSARSSRGARMPSASATSGNRSCTQFTTLRDASAATTDIIGGSVIATTVAPRPCRRIASQALT